MTAIKPICLLCLLVFPTLFFSQSKKLKTAEYPAEIRDFVREFYPELKIRKVEADYEKNAVEEYEVRLPKKRELTFNADLRIIEIEDRNGIPKKFFQKNLLADVERRYPGKKITEWELDEDKQEIELENDLSGNYDLNGNFLNQTGIILPYTISVPEHSQALKFRSIAV